jgi:oxygen-independent coproporphyrinogen-3 oxidase
MRALHAKVVEHFEIEPDAEAAIEVDPRVTTPEQMDALKEMGFSRISMGVQDFTPEVQEAIHRHQTEGETRALYEYTRTLDFHSINLDLIYGLPLQTPEKFERNMQVVLGLRPDRVAVYSYAYVPWVKANQKRLDTAQFPSPEAKLELFVLAREMFLSAGYVQIGMDHFALPGDELATAMGARRLHRNFMGYTVKMGTDMLGAGVSAIGDVRGAFAQNVKKLPAYYQAVGAGKFPIERGYTLDADDILRREVITRLMCNFHLDVREIERRFSMDFGAYFADELKELSRPDGPVEHGFVALAPDKIEVVGNGRLFVRNVCMTFDRYLRAKPGEAPLFSRTV